MLFEEKTIGDIWVGQMQEKRMDARIASEFKNRMIEVIEKGYRLIVIGLEDVDFIDSSGLGALVVTLKKLGKDGHFGLWGVKQNILNLFELTHTDRIFKIYENESEAISVITGDA